MIYNNAIGWTSNENDLFSNFKYKTPTNFCVCAPTGAIPAFQLPVSAGTVVISLSLISVTGEHPTVSILTAATNETLDVVDQGNGNYVIEYRGDFMSTIPSIGYGNYKPGLFRLQMEHGSDTYYSENFLWADDVSELIKITYWHNENFDHGNGLFSYADGFRNIMYVNSSIGKPKYEETIDRIEFDGINLDIKNIQWKEYAFTLGAPEYMIDAMRHISQHDNTEIEYEGRTYSVDEFRMEFQGWEDRGDIATLDFYFTNGTVSKIIGDSDGTTTLFEGEYNGDFNNDFTITP